MHDADELVVVLLFSFLLLLLFEIIILLETETIFGFQAPECVVNGPIHFLFTDIERGQVNFKL